MNKIMRLTTFIVLLFLLTLPSNCIYGESEETPVVSTPFEPYGTFIFVPVQVNDSTLLSFIFDTGVNRTFINPRQTKELHLGHSKEIHGGPLKLTLTKGKKPTLQVGSARLENLESLSPFFSFDELEATLGRQVDGIFGSDLLQEYVVEIDYSNHTLHLYDPKTYKYRGQEQPISLQIKNHLSFVQGEIFQNSGEPVIGTFQLDTGSDGALDLFHTFAQRHQLLENMGPTLATQTWTATAGKADEDSIGRLKAFRVGRFTLERPIVKLLTTKKGIYGRSEYAGLLGGEILKRFRVIIDYSHKWMILEPNVRLTEPFEWEMTGMNLVADADSSSYVVSEVRSQSAAAEAGVQKGDHVIAIDDKGVTTLASPEIDDMFKQEGREVRLQIKRDKETLEVKLKLRRLI
jgi:hypothetical protein